MKLAITRGFGNADAIISEVSFRLKNTKRIGRELKKLIKAYSGTPLLNNIWTWTVQPDGIVIDYGSHIHFGLIYEMTEEERKMLLEGEK